MQKLFSSRCRLLVTFVDMCVLRQIPAGDNLGGKVYKRNVPTTRINYISNNMLLPDRGVYL